jgi:putative endonuclease
MSDKTDLQETGTRWYVYIIRASDESLYTGITTDVERRFNEHLDPRKGARFFRGRKPEEVVYTERQPDRSRALQREAVIKKLSRDLKLELIRRDGY